MTTIKLTSIKTGESITDSLKGTKRTITNQFKRMYKAIEKECTRTNNKYLVATIDSEKYIVNFK